MAALCYTIYTIEITALASSHIEVIAQDLGTGTRYLIKRLSSNNLQIRSLKKCAGYLINHSIELARHETII